MKPPKLIPTLLYFFLNTITSAYAQDRLSSPEALSLKSSPIITPGYLFQLFISLVIVFGIMYLISKYILPKLKISTKGKIIEVIDKIGLEPQVGAYIIKVKGSSWLVIVSNKNVSVVSKLETD